MHHQQIDEFSVTDFRHTAHEVWRVIRARRWFLLFPFCIVSTVACLGSLLVPRQYTARTVIRREHDPVFANMTQKGWLQPYNDIRLHLSSDISDPKFIEEVLAAEDLPEGLERFDDGTLTPAGSKARQQLAAAVAAGLTTKTIEASSYRDVVEIDLTMPKPAVTKDILGPLRDRYVAQARRKTVAILKSVEAFLRTEVDRRRDKFAKLQRRRMECELKYPGIDPNGPDPAQAERSTLVIERAAVERKMDDLSLQQEKHKTKLATLVGPQGDLDSDAGPVMLEEPNPRYVQLVQEIEHLEKAIAEGKSVRSMTEEHPEIKRNRALLAERRAELARMPRTLMVSAKVAGNRAANLARVEKLKKELADGQAALVGLDNRLNSIQERFARLDRDRSLAIEHRPEYFKLKNEADQLSSELNVWQQNIAPIEHVLYLEDKNRSIHFTTVQDVALEATPTSPDARLVMMICFGIGLGSAILSVLLVELIDRSYRTVKQLSTSLGVPVIESIDETVTRAIRRRRLFRRLVVMPALATILVAVTALAGATAYLSLERPGEYGWFSLLPGHVVQVVGGRNDFSPRGPITDSWPSIESGHDSNG